MIGHSPSTRSRVPLLHTHWFACCQRPGRSSSFFRADSGHEKNLMACGGHFSILRPKYFGCIAPIGAHNFRIDLIPIGPTEPSAWESLSLTPFSGGHLCGDESVGILFVPTCAGESIFSDWLGSMAPSSKRDFFRPSSRASP